MPTEGGAVTVEQHSDIAGLTYEQARDELASIVTRLEAGQVPLEESMSLWRRGEALAAHCSTWLDGAQAQLESTVGATSEPDGPGRSDEE